MGAITVLPQRVIQPVIQRSGDAGKDALDAVTTQQKVIDQLYSTLSLVAIQKLIATDWQDLTVNNDVRNVYRQWGWSFIKGDGVNSGIVKAITFPEPYATVHGVTALCLGKKTASDPTAPTDSIAWVDVNEIGLVDVQGGTLTTSGVSLVVFRRDGGVLTNNTRYLFFWEAMGN